MADSNGFLQHIREGGYNVSDLCSGEGLLSDVFRVVTSRSLHEFLQSCTAPIDWQPQRHPRDICSGVYFNCDVLTSYLDASGLDKRCAPSTEISPCQQDQSTPRTAIGLLVGLTLAGFLIGCLCTCVLCMLAPRLHSWASLKLGRTRKQSEKDVTSSGRTASGAYGDVYMDIDEQRNRRSPRQQHPLPAEPITHPPPDHTTSHTDNAADTNQNGEYAALDYEPLTRADPSQQSHKYALINGTAADEPPEVPDLEMHPSTTEEEHEGNTAPQYFILEKT